MSPDGFLTSELLPGLEWFTKIVGPVPPASREAKLLMLAIAGQESAWTDRVQGGNGPAHGFYQFERSGGVAGVLANTATSHWAMAACVVAGIHADSTHVWGVMATAKGDNLACAFARLLLWTSPAPLPALGDENAGWLYYEHLWRPGKPDRSRWAIRYPQAVAAIHAHEAKP